MKIAKHALTAIAAFLAVYVVYAHAAAWKTAALYRRESAIETLSTEHEVRRRGGLEAHGSLVEGTASEPSSFIEWIGPARPLADLALAMRVRTSGTGSFDASIGVEDERGERRTLVALHNSAEPTVGLVDGEGARTPMRLEHPEMAHEIALRLSPELHLATIAVDGIPLSSFASSWDAGTLVRAFYGVEAKQPGEHVSVEIESVHVSGVPRESQPLAFTERFEGKVVDPIRWRALTADQWTAESRIAVDPSGLVLEGRSLRGSGSGSIVLLGPTFSLRSFHASMRFRPERIKRTSVFLGVTNTRGGLPQWRAFDIGVLDGAAGVQPFAAGHWEQDGQHRLNVVGPIAPSDLDAFLDYDAHTGVARAGIGSDTLFERHLDLEPLEDVQLHLGANLSGPDADCRVVVREVRFEPR